MRPITLLRSALPALALTGSVCVAPRSSDPPTTTKAAPGRGVAVVELFTSEGCSSCPPADALVKRLSEQAEQEGRAVFALSFHVDYWNRLGWRDPFSDAAWSARQQAYADRLPGGVYTPEAVVNGRTAFVGSDEQRWRRAVDDALATPATVQVDAQAVQHGDHITVEVELQGMKEGRSVVAVLAEDGLGSDVAHGENGGRHLEHARVVRALAQAAAAADVKLDLEASTVKDSGRAHVIVFVQDAGQGEVRGAAEARLTR